MNSSPEIPHFLRFARTLALLGGVACVGCSDTATGTDAASADASEVSRPPTDTPPVVDAGIMTAPDTGIDAPPPGIVVAPDAGIDAAPVDVVRNGIMPAPDAGIMTSPDAGSSDDATSIRLDGPLPGVVIAPDAPDA